MNLEFVLDESFVRVWQDPSRAEAEMRSFVTISIVILVLAGAGYILVNYWSYIFSKTVSGRVEAVEKLQIPVAIMGTHQNPTTADRQLFSFAVAIRQEDGKIFTASSEDRQWMVVSKGICVTAKLFPYPPWHFDKGGTYFNARLDMQYDCPPSLAPAE